MFYALGKSLFAYVGKKLFDLLTGRSLEHDFEFAAEATINFIKVVGDKLVISMGKKLLWFNITSIQKPIQEVTLPG